MSEFYRQSVRRIAKMQVDLSYVRTADEVYRILKTAAHEIIQADGIVISRREGEFCHYIDELSEMNVMKGKRIPLNECAAGFSILQGQALVFHDLNETQVIPIASYSGPLIRTALAFPIRKNNPIGALGAYWTRVREVHEEELELMQILADCAAVSFESIALFQNYQNSLIETSATAAALKARTFFIANLIHEIRNPMHTVVGMTEILSADTEPKILEDSLVVMKRAGAMLMHLSKDFLELTKLESGKLVLEKSNFSLREVLTETMSLILNAANEKKLDVSFEIDPLFPEMLAGDPFRIKQILLNFLTNAVKFTRAGSIRTHARVVQSKGDMHRVRISVRDTGVGIPLEKQRQVFGKFDQLSLSTARAHGGSGLGLSICRELAHLMNGNVGFDSTEGMGSHFYVDLPLPEVSVPAAPTPVLATPGTTQPSLRVLIADDVIDNCHLLKLYLSDLMATVDFAKNGKEAIEMWEKNEYDLVLMDMHMPLMNGNEAALLIREKEISRGRKPIPIFGLSAENNDKGTFRGFDFFLEKPFSRKDIRDAVEGFSKLKR